MILSETVLDVGENDPGAPLPTTMSFPGIAERQKVNQERSRLREIEIQQRVDPNECVDQFWYNFKETVSKINASLTDVLSSSHVTAAQRKEGRRQLDDLNMLILELQQSASQSVAVFLPKADARRANEEVLSLFEKLNQAREIICPREKFTFQKYRAARDERQASSNAQRRQLHCEYNTIEEKPGEIPSCDTTHVPFIGEDSYGFDNKTNCHLSYDDSTSLLSIKEHDTEEHTIHVNSHDTSNNFYLSNLINCIVTLKTVCGSLKIKNNENCVIYCGPVSGPVFVEHCTNCTVVVASRQLRIHESTNVHFIIFVASGPIIEDCSQTYFSRLYIPVIQEKLWNNNANEDFSAILDRMVSTRLIHIPREQKRDSSIIHVIDEQNEYQSVKDFKWHKLLQQSPNWSALSDKDTNEFLKQLERKEIIVSTH